MALVSSPSTKFRLTVICLTVLAVAACQTPATPVTNQDNQLTHGNVQLNVRVGVTTQAEILQVFGAPNITTIDGEGQEVWTYQRHATVAQTSASSNYWTVLLLGGSSQAAGFEQSSRTMTLIIKFDENDVVSDFRSRASSF